MSPSAGVQWRTDVRDLGGAIPSDSETGQFLLNWVLENYALIVSAIVFVVLAFTTFVVLTFIAQGAMARASTDAAWRQPTGLGRAWDAGLRYFWRYLRLWILSALIWLLILIAFVLVIVALGLGANVVREAAVAMYTFGTILVIAALLLFLPLVIIYTIVFAYAQRAIVVQDAGVRRAIVDGWRLFRRRPGASLLVWLLSLLLGLAAGILLSLATLLIALPLGGAGVALYLGGAAGPLTNAYAVLALAFFIFVAWVLTAIANTFFWHLWTLAYLRLTNTQPPASEAPDSAPPVTALAVIAKPGLPVPVVGPTTTAPD